ncbi:hypothetical protein IBTHAUMO2_730006 [Nitrosopumilaceae archaeon]|nr:hypothetical protein [Nitrosopumilus sp.]MDA7999397.1 hypothetical protein [Nitrosopumilus sp.]CAI9830643.1 hypothetical protein IBTHAUMO2_1020003 [Nitrosopumilaceae archaeon]CAI9832343.1 hypothetical protein IBTHAUMO2_730006 [Nitrosopumilaceae archaeon]
MAAKNASGRPTVRCPECEIGILSTPSFTSRAATTKRHQLPVRVCRRCKIVILIEKTWSAGWRVWNSKEYVTKLE